MRIRRPIPLFVVLALAVPLVAARLPAQSYTAQPEDVWRALAPLEGFTPILLDTTTLTRLAEVGRPVTLPFSKREGDVVLKTLQLSPIHLRVPGLTSYILKNGTADEGTAHLLPPTRTYQGFVEKTGSAAITISPDAVEGNMLDHDGWSIIEPLEPLLRRQGVPGGIRDEILRHFNHIVYNVEDLADGRDAGPRAAACGNISPGGEELPVKKDEPSGPLILRMAADGDRFFAKAYPIDSVMPFHLKQETILNAIDWLYNCIEADANASNAYAHCANDFDGGHGAYQVQIRIERLEVWTSGGPDSRDRIELLRQSIAQSHQSEPPCCGPPHTAGKADLVHFMSGRIRGGEAAGVGGLGDYGAGCEAEDPVDLLCHHSVSRVVPDNDLGGTVFGQQLLVAHEIGHNNGGAEEPNFFAVCWLSGKSCGPGLMHSLFTPKHKFLYKEDDCRGVLGPLLRERLAAPEVP